jgi:hypothetical protein
MSGRERGKQLLADLAKKVKEEVAPSGEPVLHARGQKAVADLASDLSGPDAPPGLRVFKDAVDRFRLQRPGRNGQIAVAWDRPIGAIVVQVEKLGRRERDVRYRFEEGADEWRRMEGEGELYADIAQWLADVLYPESKRA